MPRNTKYYGLDNGPKQIADRLQNGVARGKIFINLQELHYETQKPNLIFKLNGRQSTIEFTTSVPKIRDAITPLFDDAAISSVAD